MRSRKVLFTFALALAAVALLASPVFGQSYNEPEGELSDARCYGHHREEGFRSMDLYPDAVKMVRKGEAFEFTLTVRNPWLHELHDPSAFVNISKAPGFSFPGEQPPAPFEVSGELGGPGGDYVHEAPLPVDVNATLIVATLEGAPGSLNANDFDIYLIPPATQDAYNASRDGYSSGVQGEGTPWREDVRVAYRDISQHPPGEWTLRVELHSAGEGQLGQTTTPEAAPFEVTGTVFYNLSKQTEIRVDGPASIKSKKDHTFRFQIVPPEEPVEQVELIYGGSAIAYHDHTDANTEDYGNYTKWSTITFAVGDQEVIGQAVITGNLLDPGPVMRSWGQVLGFAGSFLLVPSLVLGGVFGPKSVRFFNKTLGARRRVLWHNSSSYLLLVVALLHMVLFLVENFWDWGTGMVWGGLSLAAMIGLGVTGGFQRRMVAQWGFARWRFIHFFLGILVVFTVLVHLVADGSHLAFAREWFGASTA